MLIRTVRMTFREEEVENFQSVFEASKEKIRHFPGCRHLELWQDFHTPNVFLTYSHWDDAAALDGYRHSELFESVWAKTKVLFQEKPVAFSSKQLQKIN